MLLSTPSYKFRYRSFKKLVQRSYKFIDFKRTLVAGRRAIIVKKNIYDPNRSAKITLVGYGNGYLSYVLES